MNKTNIVYGMSTTASMKKSNLLNKKIIEFNMPLSVTDLSTINNHEIILPKDIYHEEINYSFKEAINSLNKSIDNKEEFRIWTSHYEINSYLLLLYMCNYLKNKDCNIYVVFSDEYDKEIYSPAWLRHNELELALKVERKLSIEEIDNYAKEWIKVYNSNTDMRILENKEVKSVSFDYYNDMILDKLKSLGEVKLIKITGIIMQEYYLSDIVIVYLIDRLIEKNKIKIVKESNERYFENVIALRD